MRFCSLMKSLAAESSSLDGGRLQATSKAKASADFNFARLALSFVTMRGSKSVRARTRLAKPRARRCTKSELSNERDCKATVEDTRWIQTGLCAGPSNVERKLTGAVRRCCR